MKIGRFKWGERTIYGVVKGKEIEVIKESRVWELMESVTPTGEVVSFKEVKFLSPKSPSMIVAVGLNYKDHA